jgi:Flp pilus assembly pilin Flp
MADGLQSRSTSTAVRDESGQTFVEYSLVLVLVAVAASLLAAWTNLDNAISAALASVAAAL